MGTSRNGEDADMPLLSRVVRAFTSLAARLAPRVLDVTREEGLHESERHKGKETDMKRKKKRCARKSGTQRQKPAVVLNDEMMWAPDWFMYAVIRLLQEEKEHE